MLERWRLNRTKQCLTCPWRVEADPYEIPGYDPERHRKLSGTIAEPGRIPVDGVLKVMSCHYSEEGEEYLCLGWLHNQMGEGNNIQLRLNMRSCENAGEIELIGEQHPHFDDTLPPDVKGETHGRPRPKG